MKKILFFLIFSASITGSFSQDFEIPVNFKPEKPEDYAKYEKNIIQCIDWIMKTPVNEQTPKRKEAYAFLVKWLTGAPDVQVEINPDIVTFEKSNPDLLFIFMGGWTKYALESGGFSDKLNGIIRGIESVIDFYQKNRGNLHKDKNVERYIRRKEKGTLEDYIKDII